MEKKAKITGQGMYLNLSTGEIINIPNPVKPDESGKDVNFYKIFLKRFDKVLDKIGNQKIRVFIWILEHLSWDNKLPYTFRQLSKETGASYAVVARTMKELQEIDFIRKHNTGSYIVNPDIIFRGTYQRRCQVAGEYERIKLEHQKSSYEDDLNSVQRKIRKLQKQEENLRQRIEIMSTEEMEQEQP